MSAIRGTDRRAARSHNSSPYARQAPKKKSSWSFGIGDLLSYINPLRSRRSSESEDEDGDEDGEIIEGSQADTPNSIPSSTDAVMASPSDLSVPASPQVAQNPAASLADRGHQLASTLNGPQLTPGRADAGVELLFSTPPRMAAVSPPDDTQLSPAESLEKVQKFLKEKDGQALSEWETRGLLTFLEKNVQHDNEKPEPFRFSSSPSRTPRGNSPVSGSGAPDVSPATNGETTTPRKTLPKNPNGVYRWQGGGSAKPRNRYHSPSFGTRPSPPSIKLSPAKTDTKRRRVGDDADKSFAQRVPFPAVSPQKPGAPAASAPVPTPAPSQTRPNIFPPQNGAPTTPNGTASTAPKSNGASAPRLRTTGLPTKPTAPTVPSPLRQTWGQSDSPPQTPASKPNPTPTKAASFMAELIKEVTPPKRPDLSNPYQTASPVKPPPRKPVAKRQRPSAKPVVPSTLVKAPEPSAQAVIEATIPKGSKRSRPPPELIKSTRVGTIPVPTRRSPHSQTSNLPPVNGFNGASGTQTLPVVIVEEVTDDDNDDDKHMTKKQKRGSQEIMVEEIDDEDRYINWPEAVPISRPSERYPSDSTSLKPAQPASSSNLFASNSATSFKPAFATKSSAPRDPSKLRFSYPVDENSSPPSMSPPNASFTPPPAPRFPPAQLPTTPRIEEGVDPKQAAIVMAVNDLPTYTFPVHPGFFSQPSLSADAREAAKAKSIASLPTFDFLMAAKALSTSNSFDWAEASLKPRNAPSGGSWECHHCKCDNTADSEDRCAICDTPRSKSATTPIVKSFDWTAAGAKAPSAASNTWKCAICMLANPATASQCIVCEATR